MQQVHHSICAEEDGNYSFHTHKHAQDLTEMKDIIKSCAKIHFHLKHVTVSKKRKVGVSGHFHCSGLHLHFTVINKSTLK